MQEKYPEALGGQWKIKTHVMDRKNGGKSVIDSFEKRDATHLRSGEGEYVTEIDSTLKISEDFTICMGCAFVGKDKRTKENISFLYHDVPLRDGEEIFTPGLEAAMDAFMARCEPFSVDAVLFGGKMAKKNVNEDDRDDERGYIEGIETLSKIVAQRIGRWPEVAKGPGLNEAGWDQRTSVAFDAQTRELWIIREHPQHIGINDPFSSEDVQEVVQKMREDA